MEYRPDAKQTIEELLKENSDLKEKLEVLKDFLLRQNKESDDVLLECGLHDTYCACCTVTLNIDNGDPNRNYFCEACREQSDKAR